MAVFTYLREFNLASISLRLCLAVLCGGLIGLERGKKGRAAGFRTYMLVALGAALSMLLGEYLHWQLGNLWKTPAAALGLTTDVSRFGAQVINGIGFLGAGTVIINQGKQQVTGLTTAAGLWASACMGLAVGIGFYECVVIAVLLMFVSINLLRRIEGYFIGRCRNMNLYIEFSAMEDVSRVIGRLKEEEIDIFEMDFHQGHEERLQNPSLVVILRMRRRISHTQLMASLMELECVRLVEEI